MARSCIAALWLAIALTPPGALRAQSGGSPGALRAFASDAEFEQYFREVTREADRRRCVRGIASTHLTSASMPRDSMAPGLVRGQVWGPGFKPLPGAELWLIDTAIGRRTDSSGSYGLRVPASQLRIGHTTAMTAYAKGYEPQTFMLNVQPGDTADVIFMLCPPSEPAPSSMVGTPMQQLQAGATHERVRQGDSVLVVGSVIVTLRGGRLVSIATGQGRPRLVSVREPFGEVADAHDVWPALLFNYHDEILVVGDRRPTGAHGILISHFHLEPRGALTYRGTFEVVAPDNAPSLANRVWLIGSRLVLYVPVAIPWETDDPAASLPELVKWVPREGAVTHARIFSAEHVYHPARLWDGGRAPVAHGMIACDLARSPLTCTGTEFLGAPVVQQFASPNAIYVWTKGYHFPFDIATPVDSGEALLVRIPLDGSAPATMEVTGHPVDQFSLFESADGYVNVMVRGDSGFNPHMSGPQPGLDLKLLRAPLQYFGDGISATPAWRYRPLPAATSDFVRDRFAGGYLLYSLPYQGGTSIVAVPLSGKEIEMLELPFFVGTLDRFGSTLIAEGMAGDGEALALIGTDARPRAGATFTWPRSRGSTLYWPLVVHRSEELGFIVGLPAAGAGDPGYRSPVDGFTSVLLLRERSDRLELLALVRARPDTATWEGCGGHCAESHGNARLVVADGRLYVLWRRRVIAARLSGGRVIEITRTELDIDTAVRSPSH